MSDTDVVVEFVMQDARLGELEYPSIEDVPERVELGGKTYSTMAHSAGDRAAWQHTVHTGDDGRARYQVHVIDADQI